MKQTIFLPIIAAVVALTIGIAEQAAAAEPTAKSSKPLKSSKSAAAAKPPKCDCRKTFEWMKSTFEENDAGFSYILGKKGQQAYDIHNTLIAGKIKAAKTPRACETALNEWFRFFRKSHIGLYYISPEEQEDWDKPFTDEQLAGWAKYFFIDKINENTLYMRIPSFMPYSKPLIDTLLVRNRELILSTENLIIDMQGNGGGGDGSWSELIPFLYTNPVRHTRVEFLSTPLNNKYWAETRIDDDDPEGSWARQALDSLESRPGQFYSPWGEKITTYTQDTVYEYPKKVGIIVDEWCASATEAFLIRARQSMKVKLFGVQTLGALDISNMYGVLSPDEQFRLWYGTSRGLWLPGQAFDDIGFQPDFFFDRSIPRDKWVEHTVEILNGK
jgi:hypothetical protein